MVLSPEIMNKSMLPFLMFSFIAVLTLELLLEMVKHALWVAWCWGVDEIFHWIGQHVVLHSWTRKSPTAHPYRRKFDKPDKHFQYFYPLNFSHLDACSHSRAQTFRQYECFGVHVSAELFVVHQVFIIVWPEQRVVSHHLIMERCGRVYLAICASLWMGHPQCVCVLLVTHSGHILPNFTQGTSIVLHPQELEGRGGLLVFRLVSTPDSLHVRECYTTLCDGWNARPQIQKSSLHNSEVSSLFFSNNCIVFVK